jgi:hypothetical protein
VRKVWHGFGIEHILTNRNSEKYAAFSKLKKAKGNPQTKEKKSIA